MCFILVVLLSITYFVADTYSKKNDTTWLEGFEKVLFMKNFEIAEMLEEPDSVVFKDSIKVEELK